MEAEKEKRPRRSRKDERGLPKTRPKDPPKRSRRSRTQQQQHDEETPLIPGRERQYSGTSSTKRKNNQSKTVTPTKEFQETAITWASIVASILTLLLCAFVLVGFVFHSYRGGGSVGDAASTTTFPMGDLHLNGNSNSNNGNNNNNNNKLNKQHNKKTEEAFTPHPSNQLYDEHGRFILENYDAEPPFSDFLPALAGFYGKPLYAFYVNRGQGISSFGIQSKDFPMMEFNSANKAYQNTALLGFRTFLQGSRGKGKRFLVEPFTPLATRFSTNDNDPSLPKRWMFVGSNEMEISDLNQKLGIETNVTFFVLPEEDFGAFVKRTTVRNIHAGSLRISMLDGLARMEPAGGPLNGWLKNTGRTLEGWMRVHSPYPNFDKMPFYRLSSQPRDDADVVAQEAGHWCLSVIEHSDGTINLLPIIYDGSKVFGQDTTLLRPFMLQSMSVNDLINSPQYASAKTPSAFAAMDTVELESGSDITVTTYYGKARHILDVPVIARRLMQPGFSQYKMSRSREIIEQITAYVRTQTSNALFDQHVQQMFLDNSLRGGIPNILGDVDDDAKMRNAMEDKRLKVFHLFSRIHGDLERDYNSFNIAHTFFSEGPGNYRDIIQNRRNDCVFNPRVGSFNIETFLSLVQADGYNPFTVEAVAFTITDMEACKRVAAQAVGEADGHRAQREALTGILNGGPFRPGQLFQLMEDQNIELIISRQDFVDSVAAVADSNPLADFEKGYWSDDFSYILDLVDNFLQIFPDWEQRMLFETKLPYFFSPASVQPRSLKYVLSTTYDGRGKHVRQLNATIEDLGKKEYQGRYIDKSTNWYSLEANWQHDTNAKVFQSSVMSKLILLCTIKFATRDPLGIGIEYEAGRPGWDDANNGLPSMLGSGLAELIELARLLRYVRSASLKHKTTIEIPTELAELLNSIKEALGVLTTKNGNATDWIGSAVPQHLFQYWDAVATAREEYRRKTKMTFLGSTTTLSWREVLQVVDLWLDDIDRAVTVAESLGTSGDGDDGKSGVTPTYFTYRVVEWEKTGEFNGDGYALVRAKKMEVETLPLFLEGPTRMMKLFDSKEALALYEKVRASPLRDESLGMYTVSASLKGQPVGMGREMAFAPGWLENQSVWLHMSYKFYLELLRHELFDIFFEEMRGGGILPFMDPSVYGRSLMECSSFIASSAFEDPSIRGRGFLARLSGSTSEFMSMWVLMFLGPKTFFLDQASGEIQMELRPALPRWLFDDKSSPGNVLVSFKLFGAIDVRYFHRRGAENLYRTPATRYVVGFRDGQVMNVDGPFIPAPLADKIRRIVFVSSIDVYFE